jgi:hypothetical protein
MESQPKTRHSHDRKARAWKLTINQSPFFFPFSIPLEVSETIQVS